MKIPHFLYDLWEAGTHSFVCGVALQDNDSEDVRSASETVMKLEPGTILWLEDAHWQRGFQIHEQLGRRNSSVYSAISLDEVGKPLAVHVGAHPSQLEPSWEDMSTWYQVSISLWCIPSLEIAVLV